MREKAQGQVWAGCSSHREGSTAGRDNEKETQTGGVGKVCWEGWERCSHLHTHTCPLRLPGCCAQEGGSLHPSQSPTAGPQGSWGPQTGLALDTALGSAWHPAWLGGLLPQVCGAPGVSGSSMSPSQSAGSQGAAPAPPGCPALGSGPGTDVRTQAEAGWGPAQTLGDSGSSPCSLLLLGRLPPSRHFEASKDSRVGMGELCECGQCPDRFSTRTWKSRDWLC